MDYRIHNVITILESTEGRDLSARELSIQVNLSTSRLRHLFKTETGIALTQYRKVLIMENAKELIENTFLTIKEVMFKVGVKNKGRFAQDFKKAYGLTPAEYRVHHFSEQAREATMVTK